jgi:hypothetical protein
LQRKRDGSQRQSRAAQQTQPQSQRQPRPVFSPLEISPRVAQTQAPSQPQQIRREKAQGARQGQKKVRKLIRRVLFSGFVLFSA